MRNIKLIIQYDGSHYHGWQMQRGLITVQEVLQERIEKITGKQAAVIAAGRTDAGVHALAQVVAFKTTSALASGTLMSALNALLPWDIRILSACDADADFNPRHDAKGKVYFYIIANMPVISPFLHDYAWWVPQPIDFGAICNAISLFQGTHDFTSFRASGCGAKTPVRTIFHCSTEKIDAIDFMTAGIRGDFLKLSVEGDAFLRHMVRNIAGTIIEVGKGRLKAEAITELLHARDRKLAGPTAPAKGLFLEKIFY
jgi:tRNA pseudouridine38-40 synthase